MVSEFDGPIPETTYNNELSPERQKELVGQLLKERPPRTKDRFVYYELAPDSEHANLARTVEADVFMERFKEPHAQTAKTYSPYEEQSRFLLAVDAEASKVAGALRIVTNGKSGLLTLNDLAKPASDKKTAPQIDIEEVLSEMHVELDKCWDIETVVVIEEYRKRTEVSTMLYRAMYVNARKHGVEHLVTILDENPYKKVMEPYLGIPFKPFGGLHEPFKYYNSQGSYALHGYVPDFFREMVKHELTTAKGWAATAAGSLTRLIWGTRDRQIQLLAA